jgi:hypothetical protein
MNKRRFSVFFLFLLIIYKSSSQDFQITQLQLDFSGNQLHITYNLDNKNSAGKFRIRIEIKRQNGLLIQPGAISGDIGENIKAGNNKVIIWDLGKDTISLDEDISVKLTGDIIAKSYSKGSLMLMSTVFPGWGQTKITGRPWWLCGVAAYGALAGGVIFYNKCYDTSIIFNDPLTPKYEKAALEDKGSKEFLNSRIFSVTAASIWVANLIWVAVMPNQKQPMKHARLYIKPVTIPDYQGAMLSVRVNF